MEIFNDAGTFVRIVEGQGVLPGYVTIVDSTNGPSAVTDTLLITSCTFDAQSNYSLNQSLSRLVYLYSFGNVPPTVTISGIILAEGNCNSDTPPSNIQGIYEFYKNNSVSSGQDVTPFVTLDLSGLVIQGLLVGLNMTIQDPSQRVWSYRLTVRTST